MGYGLGTIVRAFVVRKMQRLKRTARTLEVLGDGFTAFEGDFISVQIQHLQGIILKQMLHQNVDTIASQFVLLDRKLLQTHIILEHLPEVYGY